MDNCYTKKVILKQIDKFYELVKKANNFEEVKDLYWYLENKIQNMKRLDGENKTSEDNIGVNEYEV